MQKKLSVLVVTLLASAGVMAQTAPAAPTTVAELASGVSFASATTAMLAIAGVVIAFKVVKQGAQIVIGWVSKAR